MFFFLPKVPIFSQKDSLSSLFADPGVRGDFGLTGAAMFSTDYLFHRLYLNQRKVFTRVRRATEAPCTVHRSKRLYKPISERQSPSWGKWSKLCPLIGYLSCLSRWLAEHEHKKLLPSLPNPTESLPLRFGWPAVVRRNNENDSKMKVDHN